MSWRGRLFFVTGCTVFGAITWAEEPYWSSKVRSAESTRGRLAREQRARDTAADIGLRAALGGAAGLTAGMLSFAVRSRRGRTGNGQPGGKQHPSASS